MVAAAGYGVLILSAPYLGPERYVAFAAFWAALYLGIGSIFGIQQELTREVSASEDTTNRGPRLLFAAITVGLCLSCAVVVSSPLWGPAALGEQWIPLVGLIAAGLILYAGHATMAGILAGSVRWTGYSGLLLLEAALRLIAVALVCSLPLWSGSVLALAIATVSALAAWLLLLFIPSLRRMLRYRTSSPLSAVLRRLGQATGATAANALLVTGFPLLIAMTAREADATDIGTAILVLTLVRAPVLLPLNALLGMLLSVMIRNPNRTRRYLRDIAAIIAVTTLVLAVVGGLLGSPVIAWAFGPDFLAPPAFIAGCALGTGLIALITATGAALLSKDRHKDYLTGWLGAAVVAVLLLVLPIEDIYLQIVMALVCGPTAGALYHLFRLRSSAPQSVGLPG